MATFEFTCQKCEGNFEIEAQDLIDGSEELECPHCNARLSKAAAEDFTAAVAEFLAQLAAISKKFTVTVEIDSEAVAEDSDEDDEDEDDDDDLDEDEDEDDDDDLDEDEDIEDER
jgi:DNA-directed RNA polymerase subunit RPC12/RpoP